MKYATVLVLLGLGAAAGCGADTLEDGYKYQPLSLNESQKRGMYAPPYSQDSQNADQAQQDEMKARKPTP